jgi:hypothetical protein
MLTEVTDENILRQLRGEAPLQEGGAAEALTTPSTATSGLTEVTDPALLEEIRGYGTAPRPKPTESIEEGSWMDDPVMAARMLIGGLTMEFGDEIGAGIAAGAVKLSGSEVPYTEIYREMKDQLDVEASQYRKDNPIASTVLGVAGGIATGGVGAIKGGVAGVRALPAGTSLVTKANVVAGGAVGRGAIGGAIGGAGAAETGNTLEGAGYGAGFGAGAGILFKGVGSAWNVGTRRRVAQELGSGDTFIPLNLAVNSQNAGEETLGSMYKSVVGTAFGGRSILGAQEARILNPIRVSLKNAEQYYSKATANAKSALNSVRKQQQAVMTSKIGVLRDQKQQVLEAGKDAKEAVNLSFQESKDQALMSAAKEVDGFTEDAVNSFRSQAFLRSVPEGTPQNIIDDILNAPSPNLASSKLDALWKVDGFKMLKGRKFRIDPAKITKEMGERLKKDTFMIDGMDSNKFQRTVELANEFLSEKLQKGNWIDGEDLSDLRSKLGRTASAVKDTGGGQNSVDYAMFKTIQDVLNEKVTGQLSKTARAQFEAQQSQWATKMVLDRAVATASTKAGTRGAFSPDDWKSSLGFLNKTRNRRGEGILGREADDLADMVKSRDTAITDAAETVVNNAQKQMKATLKVQSGKTRAGIKKLQLEESDLRSKSGVTVRARIAENKKELANKRLVKDDLQNSLDNLESLSSSTSTPTPFTRMASTLFLGGIPAVLTGGFAAPAGVLIARKLASESAQRALAGQTGIQKGLFTAGQQYGNTLGQGLANVAGMNFPNELIREQGIQTDMYNNNRNSNSNQ